ncbi:hypothetical protein EMCRGX_G020766 [Ephydatia muelleri]
MFLEILLVKPDDGNADKEQTAEIHFVIFITACCLIQLFKPRKCARTSNAPGAYVISFINRRIGDVVQYCSQQALEDSSSQSMLKRCSLVFKCLSYFDLKVNPFLQASAAISIL